MRVGIIGALISISVMAMSNVAQAQTFIWTGPSSFDDAQINFGGAPFNATKLNINGNARFDDQSPQDNAVYKILLLLNGGGTKEIASGSTDPTLFGSAAFDNLSFLTASIIGIRFESNPDGRGSFNNFTNFSNTQFVFSNIATAVPGPVAGAALIPLLAFAGAYFVGRRRRNTLSA